MCIRDRFKTRNFRYGVIAMALGYMAFFAMTVLMPLWLQTVMNYTPTWAGIATAPVGLLALVLSPLVGKNIQRFDMRLGATFAYVVFGLTALWFSTLNLDTSLGHIVMPRFAQSISVAFFFIPINHN